MNYIGISAGFHDASLSVINSSGDILFAGHNERYSKIKNDKNINSELIQDGLSHINGNFELHYYEKPLLKYLRRLYSGEKPSLSELSVSHGILGERNHKLLNNKKIYTHNHHLSHAAAGFQTSNFNEATVVIIDAIGEFDTVSIWDARYNNGIVNYKKLYSRKYPNSLGLFYSALTQRIGLIPNDEEYITMGMAAYGEPKYYNEMKNMLLNDTIDIDFSDNLHVGFKGNFFPDAKNEDLAASGQLLLEDLLKNILNHASLLGKSSNLVYGGGVALNCLANRLLGRYFDKVWILPNPGDAGSSLGCAALAYKRKLNWNNAYLGYNIEGPYPVDDVINSLLNEQIVGVASGRAEFGPRALGNRSLLADPRGVDIKDRVNAIKRRQQFRPFAPVILEEFAYKYFRMPRGFENSRYMQSVATCRFPKLFPAIVHVDGTSRVQTVPKDGSGIRQLLEKWYAVSNCPILLNTSLNIRGEPMVNDRADADRFENMYNVKVCS